MDNQQLTTNNEFPLPKNSYAAFDAISLRNLILQRLNDQNIFTDQNYIGSNLASIIDIVSYSYNTLMFYLHKTSTESTFTEAQLYENISKIVRLLDYKPIGYQTSTLSFQASANATATTSVLQRGAYTIPRYSYILIGNVPFSFNEDVSFVVANDYTSIELSDISNKKLLYQGVYKENPIYIAAGDQNETVTINITDTYVDHFNIDVYVYENKSQKWHQYKNVPSLYTEQASSKIFEKRLNQNQQYEIIFGDGVNGRKLEQNDRVAIYFLQSLGTQGVIGPNALNQGTKIIYAGSNYSTILTDINTEQFEYINASEFSSLTFLNVVGSTVPKDIETVESIKKNAPANFKSQYRLVTKEDIQSFITTNFANFIGDVKIFNNWEYTNNYLKYFHDISISPTAYKQILLNNLLYADSCNFNNIYICAVPKISIGSSLKYLLPAQKEAILSNIQPLKPLTTEITFMDPVFKALAIGVKTPSNELNIDDKDLCFIQIIKTSTSKRSSRSIADDAINVFNNFFNPVATRLGGVFSYNTLVSELLSIDGVHNIQTINKETQEVFEGLSFYMWNPSYMDIDKQVITSNYGLNDFEFFYFENLATLFNKIEVLENTLIIQ